MKVELKAITRPVDSEQTTEDFIAYVARVSNPANQNNKLTAAKLLKYLAKNKHWSPFEMVNLVVEVKTTRDIARQLLRHGFRFQEFSQRYAEAPLEWEYREARMQDSKNRQNSLETTDDGLIAEWFVKQALVAQAAQEAYRWAIEKGIAKEVARVVLPEGMTPTTLYFNGNVRNLIHYTQVRTDPTTQKEHREIAQAIWDQIVIPNFPSLTNILEQ